MVVEHTSAIVELATRSQRAVRITVAALLALAVVAAVVVFVNRDSRLDRAASIAKKDSNFDTAQLAGESILRISILLRDEAEACSDDRGAAWPRCGALFAGSAHMQITAARVLQCTRPEIYDARRRVRAYLRAASANPERARLPELPDCS